MGQKKLLLELNGSEILYIDVKGEKKLKKLKFLVLFKMVSQVAILKVEHCSLLHLKAHLYHHKTLCVFF